MNDEITGVWLLALEERRHARLSQRRRVVGPKSCSSREIAEMTSVMPADLETALLIAVPDMPKVIRDTRLRLDPGAALGVPEHVAVTYPFALPRRCGRGDCRSP